MRRRAEAMARILRRWALAGGVACALVAGLVAPARAQYEPALVTFLDVGQGDAVLVQSPEGRTALIDAGPPGVDLVPALRGLGVRQLDLVVATHPHADHIGGMLQVLRSFPVRYYMDNGRPYTTATYMTVMKELQRRPDIGYLQATPRTVQLGSVGLEVLPMPPYPGSNPNDESVGIVLAYGSFRALLSGDSEQPEQLSWVQSGLVPDVTLLKAPHHGSDDAMSEALLMVAQPEVVVVSVGYGNTYGHPHPSALRAYERYAHELYRTDRDGQVTVAGYDDGGYRVDFGPSLGGNGAYEPGVFEPEEKDTRVRPAPPAPLTINVVADAPGNDHQNTNGEYAVLSNGTARALDISGWTLCDAASHCFTFPAGSSIAGGSFVVLYTGRGRANGRRFYMGSGQAVWNNDGDTATLYDEAGAVVAQHAY